MLKAYRVLVTMYDIFYDTGTMHWIAYIEQI